jgi:peroxiredoxin
MLAVGDRAPDFALVDAEGATRALGEALATGPVVIAFLKADCAACNLAFPYLERLRQAYPDRAWTLWGVSQHPARAAQWFARNTGVTFPLLIDGEDFPVSRAYDPDATPTIFLVDGGEVRAVLVGFAKAELNGLATRIAALTGTEPAEVAPEDDGKPSFRPG